MKTITVERSVLERSVCRDSFFEFLKRFWSTIIPEEFDCNWHIQYLCDELQKMAENVFANRPKEYDLVINISPGSTKSTICSIMFPAWVWTRMPTARTICGSYSAHLALDLSRRSRDIVQSDKWINLFGDIQLREDQNCKGFFLNSSGGFRMATGTGGSVTGFHGHFILVDDPLDPHRAISEAELKTANEWMKNTLSTRKVSKDLTPTILIMQRLHQDDPSAQMVERGRKIGGVKHICLPAEINHQNRRDVKPRLLAKNYQDGLMDRKRLSLEVLKKFREELGEYNYAGQFLQRPVPLGGGMFKTDRIKIVGTEQEVKSFKSIYRYWDKAGTGGKGAYTVGLLMAMDKDNQIWVLDVVRGQWDSDERERIIVQTAESDGRKVRIGVEQEPGSGGKESAENTVKRLHGYSVKIDKPVGDKVMRADPYSTQVNGGNVRLKKGEWNRAYLEELQYFPNSTYKDQVDASSGAYSLLAKQKIRVGGF